jgi:hypothetical protein
VSLSFGGVGGILDSFINAIISGLKSLIDALAPSIYDSLAAALSSGLKGTLQSQIDAAISNQCFSLAFLNPGGASCPPLPPPPRTIDPPTPPSPRSPPIPNLSPLELALLARLDGLLDVRVRPLINSAVQSELPNTFALAGLSTSGSFPASCVIPSPFGGCLCVGTASYSAQLNSLSGLHTMALAELAVTNLNAAITGPRQFTAEMGGGGQSGIIALAVSGSATGSATACDSSFSAAGTISGLATFGVRVFLSALASQCTVDSIDCVQGVSVDVQLDEVVLFNSELKDLRVSFAGTDPLAVFLNTASNAIVTLVELFTSTLFQDLANLLTDLLVPMAQQEINGVLDECFDLDIIQDGQGCDPQHCALPESLCHIGALSGCA